MFWTGKIAQLIQRLLSTQSPGFTCPHPRNGGRMQLFINFGYMTLSHRRTKETVKRLSDKNCLSYKPAELNSILDPTTGGRREEALQLFSDLHIHTVAHLSMHAHTHTIQYNPS